MARRRTATRKAAFSIPIGWRGCFVSPAPPPPNVPAIDTVYVDFRNSEGFRRECEEACRDGFVGKLAIHPAQVPIINEVFTPSADALAHAQSIVDAFAQNPGAGVVGIGGVMYDRPHLARAKRLLAQATQSS